VQFSKDLGCRVVKKLSPLGGIPLENFHETRGIIESTLLWNREGFRTSPFRHFLIPCGVSGTHCAAINVHSPFHKTFNPLPPCFLETEIRSSPKVFSCHILHTRHTAAFKKSHFSQNTVIDPPREESEISLFWGAEMAQKFPPPGRMHCAIFKKSGVSGSKKSPPPWWDSTGKFP